jgi:hypothetical protein
MSDASHPRQRLRRLRDALPALIALYAVLSCWSALEAGIVGDWRYFWPAARAVLEGQDPYAVVASRGELPLFYPGPALVLLAPFGALAPAASALCYAGLSGLGLGFAARRYGRALPPACLSTCFIQAIWLNQWSPLLLAGAILPGLGFILAAKPSIGAALWGWRPNGAAAAAGVLLTLISLVLLPTWPLEWWASVRSSHHFAGPLFRPYGWILLLAVLRWRSPEARLLLLLASVPQTTGLYESLPLFLIPKRRVWGYLLILGSYLAAVAQPYAMRQVTALEPAIAANWPVILTCLWLPALGLVLFESDPDPSAPAGPPAPGAAG